MKKSLALALAALTLVTATAMGAGTGKLDPSFGEGGRVISTAALGAYAPGLGSKAALSPDGRTYVLAGERTILAFEPNGQVATGFGAGGARDAFLPEDLVLGSVSIAVDHQGRVLVAATIVPEEKPDPEAERQSDPVPEIRKAILVARFTAAGQPDPGFGSNGRIVTHFDLPPPTIPASPRFGPGAPRHPRVSSNGIVVDAAGRVVLSGQRLAGYGTCSGSGDLYLPEREAFLARLGDDGRPDPSFGRNGVVALRMGPVGSPVADEGGGAFASVGTPLPCGNRWATGYLFHLDAAGAPVAGFGNGGWRIIPEDPYVKMLPDGRGGLILMPRSSLWNRMLILRRLLADGTWDRRFGPKGVAEPFPFPEGTLSFADAAIGRGGRIYVTGSWTRKARGTGAKHRFLLFRLDRLGRLDRRYGILRTGFGRGTAAFSRFLLIAPGGRPLVIGSLGRPPWADGENLAMARYLPGR